MKKWAHAEALPIVSAGRSIGGMTNHEPTAMPMTPKCRERLSRRRLPNPMRKRAHGGRRSIGGTADQASPGSESNRRATQGTGEPFAAFVCTSHRGTPGRRGR